MLTRFVLAAAIVLAAPTTAFADDEEEWTLRVIAAARVCSPADARGRVEVFAFGAGIDLKNLTTEQSKTLKRMSRLLEALPTKARDKVCKLANQALDNLDDL